MKFRSLLCALLAAMVVPCAGLFFLDVDNTRTNVPPPVQQPRKRRKWRHKPQGRTSKEKENKGELRTCFDFGTGKKLIGH